MLPSGPKSSGWSMPRPAAFEQRAAVQLTTGGVSCEETAAVMQCPTNTVKTRMLYARRKLRVLLPHSMAPLRRRRDALTDAIGQGNAGHLVSSR